MTAFSGTRMLPEGDHQQNEAEAENDRQQQRHPVAEVRGEVGRPSGGAADLGLDIRCRDDVLAQSFHELGRLGVLRGGGRVDEHEGEVVRRCRRDDRELHPLVCRLQPVGEGLNGFWVTRRGALDGDDDRSIGPRPEALGEEVVGARRAVWLSGRLP